MTTLRRCPDFPGLHWQHLWTPPDDVEYWCPGTVPPADGAVEVEGEELEALTYPAATVRHTRHPDGTVAVVVEWADRPPPADVAAVVMAAARADLGAREQDNIREDARALRGSMAADSAWRDAYGQLSAQYHKARREHNAEVAELSAEITALARAAAEFAVVQVPPPAMPAQRHEVDEAQRLLRESTQPARQVSIDAADLASLRSRYRTLVHEVEQLRRWARQARRLVDDSRELWKVVDRLHVPVVDPLGDGVTRCSTCVGAYDHKTSDLVNCAMPCPTRRALDAGPRSEEDPGE